MLCSAGVYLEDEQDCEDSAEQQIASNADAMQSDDDGLCPPLRPSEEVTLSDVAWAAGNIIQGIARDPPLTNGALPHAQQAGAAAFKAAGDEIGDTDEGKVKNHCTHGFVFDTRNRLCTYSLIFFFHDLWHPQGLLDILDERTAAIDPRASLRLSLSVGHLLRRSHSR